jgi:anti-anti-sigma regulatory factor
MTDSSKDRQVQHTVIVLEGDLTVENAGALQTKLRAVIETSESVVLQFSGNAGIDISFLQLVCAAYRSSLASGKDLTISPDIPDGLNRAVQSAGFAYHPVWDLYSNKGKEMYKGGGNE